MIQKSKPTINPKKISTNIIDDWCICFEPLNLENHLMCPHWGVLWCKDWIQKHWTKRINKWTHCNTKIKLQKLTKNRAIIEMINKLNKGN